MDLLSFPPPSVGSIKEILTFPNNPGYSPENHLSGSVVAMIRSRSENSSAKTVSLVDEPMATTALISSSLSA